MDLLTIVLFSLLCTTVAFIIGALIMSIAPDVRQTMRQARELEQQRKQQKTKP